MTPKIPPIVFQQNAGSKEATLCKGGTVPQCPAAHAVFCIFLDRNGEEVRMEIANAVLWRAMVRLVKLKEVRIMDRSASARPATAREIILEIVRNMRAGLEPLQYTTLPPSIYDVYLHADDLDRLRGIVPRILDEARRALDEALLTVNRASLAERLRVAKAVNPKVVPPEGGWQIRVLENTDDDVHPGDIVIHSELALPARTEFGSGSMTKRIATRRLGGQQTVTQTYTPAVAALPAEGEAWAFIQYEDNGGRKSYWMKKDEIVVGRGGQDYWTDLKLDTRPDVSREHFRLRRDPASGRFFLKDLSRLGTTINGTKAPSSIEFVDGEKRDRNVEAPVPDTARIGLADVLYLEFRSTRNG